MKVFFIMSVMAGLRSMKIDLWSVVLDAPSETVRRLFDTLSVDEQARTRHFDTATLRTRYTIARAALRAFIGAYLDGDPASVRFDYASGGKPLVKGGSLDFNLSHSGNLAIYAFTRGCEIGIDLEERRAVPDLLHIARRYFAPKEYAELAALDPSLRTDAFFRCWTRKEAYLKAIGEGIVAPLDQFEVTLLPDDPPALRHIGEDRAAAARWHVHHLVPAPGYVGALAAAVPIEMGAWRTVIAEELADGSPFAA